MSAGDIARVNITPGKSAADFASQAIGDSQLGGGAAQIPSEVSYGQADQGDNSVASIVGDRGSSLIPAGGNVQQVFNERESARERTTQPTSAPTRSDVSTRREQQDVQQASDGRVLLSPQAGTSSGLSAQSDSGTISEEGRNQNMADLNIEAPPAVGSSFPLSVVSGDFKSDPALKHAKSEPSKPISIEETARLVADARSGIENNAGDSNIVEDNYRPTKNRNRLQTKDVPSSEFYQTERAVKESTTKAVASKNWTGNGFTEKVTASRHVDPEDVSIGSKIIEELVREPGNNLIQIVNQATGLNFTVEQVLERGGLSSFCDAINQSTIYVVGSKSPVPNPESAQRRRLRVHYGRGVRVHPTQTKIYNLDFDGDGVTIQFNTDGTLFRNAMDLLKNSMGEPMIDLDFFPIAQIPASRSEFREKFKTLFLTRVSQNIDTDRLADAIYDLMYPDMRNGEISDKEACLEFIDAMDAVASNYSNRHTVLSYILKDVFETMLFIKQVQVEHMVNSAPDVMSDIIEMPADHIVTMVIQDMAVGNLPPNFQDFLIGLGRYIGEVPEKNVMFRLGADVAKRVKFSGSTFKGEAGARELYELTLEAGMAAFMSGRANIGDKIGYIQQVAKRKIIKEVKFPDSVDENNGTPIYQDTIDANGNVVETGFQKWLSAFVVSYNKWQGMLDAAGIEFSCDLDPVWDTIKDKAIDGDKITDVSTAVSTIYGDYTIERMFPGAFSYAPNLKRRLKNGGVVDVHLKGNTMLPRYKRATLSKLSKDNRIGVDFDELKKVPIGEAEPVHLVLAIADKRKSTASKFNEELDNDDPRNPGLLQNFTKGLSEFAVHYRRRKQSPADFLAYSNDVMSCMHISGPDMFAYYGMDNPHAFINSHYGELLQRAANKKRNNVDHVGGVRMTMVVQYRMRVIQNINAEIDRLINEDEPLYTIPRINELQNRLLDELSILGSSSDLWGVLVQETNGNTSAFDALVSSKGSSLPSWKDSKGKEHSWCDAKDFWKKKHKKYNSLMDVMIDPAIPKSEKEKIAADVVRQATGFMELQRHEINYQLEIGPHSNYTTMSTMAYRDQPTAMSDIEKANNKFKSFFKNDWQSVVDDVKQTRAKAKEGELDSYIQHLADNPQAYMDVPDDLVVDAINAQMDKTSRASEKAHQEIPVNAFYNALSEQRGGLTNAMYRSDARVLGMILEDNLTAYDIITVLADPDLSYTVYNGNRRYILSREVLCGGTSEEALWDMLEKNPRIASMLRPGISTVYKGNIYRNAKQGFQESFFAPRSSKDVLRGKVKAQLVDRPMFLAMVAMFKPTSGRSSRSVRQETKDVLNALQVMLIGLGKRSARGEIVDVKKVFDKLGVTVESLQKLGGMDRTAAENWYNDMCDSMNRYIAEVAKTIREGGFESDARAIYEEGFTTSLSFDKSSVALAVDVRQTMTGAKTETSTSIEGAMTQDNLGLGLWCMSVRDEFTVIDGNMSEEELEPFVGCMTNAGKIEIEDLGSLGVSGNPDRIGSYASEGAVRSRNALETSALRRKIEELERSLPGDVPLVVQMPDWMVRQDQTLDPDEDFQIPSIARAAITKRTRAAEDYNLKAKKAGDDGLDSVTKSVKHIKDAAKNINIVTNIYNELGRFPAIMKLAEILKAADNAEGYNDMDLADYANIASLMIKEITDDQTGESVIVIRSIGEISSAIRHNMDQAVVEHGTPKEKIDNAAAIADEVGVQAMIKDEYLTNAALISVSSIRTTTGVGSFRPAKNAAMSSSERSFNMMWRLTNRETLKLPWGGSTMKPEASVLSRSKIRAISNRLKSRVPFDSGNYNVIGVVGKNKDRNGEIKGTDIEVSPGQLSVWYLTNNATQEEIDMALRRCYAYGMTLVFKDVSALGDKAEFFENDITPAPFGVDQGLVMLPFFDIRMNRGAISAPMSPPSFQYSPSWLWCSVEDSMNLYGLGDADALVSGEAVQNTQCIAGGVLDISFDDLFFNLRERYPDMVGQPELCSKEEIRSAIVDWKDGGPTIDFGIVDSNPNFDNSGKKLAIQLEEYRRDFEQTDENGFLEESKPDRILGWVKCYVNGYRNPVYAPIIPWPTGSGLSAPTQFRKKGDISIDPGTDSIQIPWIISEDLEGQYCKVHDGMGAAGKTMVAFSKETDLGKLRHGRSVDMVTAAQSFASRRLAWGKRMCTLKTLALTMSTPPYGYNYAEHDESFPDLRESNDPADQELLRRLQTQRIPIEEWPSLFGRIGKFSRNPETDSLLKDLVMTAIDTGTTNPSDILATKFGDAYTFMYVDYDFFFDTSLSFQNALMNWYNTMQPDVCPPSIDDYYGKKDGKGYLFKPVVQGKDEYERGCLQMAVPHKSPVTGNIFYHWENVYLSFSFFNDDYSGLHKVGLNGANRTMEQLNAMAISGKPLEGRNMQLYTENAAAPSFRTYGPNDIELDYGRFLSRER